MRPLTTAARVGLFVVGSLLGCMADADSPGVDAAGLDAGGDAGRDATPSCGSAGRACCATVPGPPCADDLFCEPVAGVCRACGGAGQICCPAAPVGVCTAPDTECADDTCTRCGNIGLHCCGIECRVGLCCLDAIGKHMCFETCPR